MKGRGNPGGDGLLLGNIRVGDDTTDKYMSSVMNKSI